MREYCLMDANETIVYNMVLSARENGPVLMPDWDSGKHWVPIELVSAQALSRYRYWNERP